MADAIEAVVDLIGDLFQAFPRTMILITIIVIGVIVAAVVIHIRNQDLRFDVPDLHFTCTGSKGSNELECQPQTDSSSKGTPCITWATALRFSNKQEKPLSVCTITGTVNNLAVIEQGDRYEINASDRTGYFYKAALNSTE